MKHNCGLQSEDSLLNVFHAVQAICGRNGNGVEQAALPDAWKKSNEEILNAVSQGRYLNSANLHPSGTAGASQIYFYLE